jgi:plastocyanin
MLTSPAGIARGCVVVVLLLLGVAPVARSTTGVDPVINVAVRITDSRIGVKPARIARSLVVVFRVVNSGKRAHDFRIAGETSGRLQPGQVGHVVIEFYDPGEYPYRCKLNCTSKMRGHVTVHGP